jgi:hypothetical protein
MQGLSSHLFGLPSPGFELRTLAGNIDKPFKACQESYVQPDLTFKIPHSVFMFSEPTATFVLYNNNSLTFFNRRAKCLQRGTD